MAVYKFKMQFQLTTAPTNLTRAIPHTGGWTEAVWASVNTQQQFEAFFRLLDKRRNLLPRQATIVGYTVQGYNIAGNRLIPLGSSTFAQNLPGNSALETDLPQVAVDLKTINTGGNNTARYVLRGMPDSIMTFGEYQPTPAYAGRMTQFMNELKSGFWIIVGRDRTQPTERVVNITGNQVTLQAALPGAGAQSFLRFLRVYGDDGNPIKGSFRITVAPVGNVYTVSPNPNNDLINASGLARLDAITTSAIVEVEVSRARVRKIGRPSQGYRGRRSKLRV